MMSTKLVYVNSAAGSLFTRRLLAELEECGMSVTTISAISELEYRKSGSLASRLVVRVKMYLGMALKSFWSACACERGVIVSTTNPFFAPLIAAGCARREVASINVLYDLFPDALVQSGAIRRGSVACGILELMTSYALRKSSCTVFLGRRLRDHCEAAYNRARSAVIIPVGADGRMFRETPPTGLLADARPKVLYCGQFGRMHDSSTVAGILGREEASLLDWSFHASGRGYAELTALARVPPSVQFGGGLDDKEWQQVMLSAQIALVTMAPGAECIVMPSKTYSALMAGQAILAICPLDSDLAELVITHSCGWVVAPGDVECLASVLRKIVSDPLGLLTRRKNAYDAGHRFYEMGVVAESWRKLIQRVELETRKSEPIVL